MYIFLGVLLICLCSYCFALFLPITFLVVSVCNNDDHWANFQRIILTLTFGSPICSSVYCFKCLLSSSLLNWKRSKIPPSPAQLYWGIYDCRRLLAWHSESFALIIEVFWTHSASCWMLIAQKTSVDDSKLSSQNNKWTHLSSHLLTRELVSSLLGMRSSKLYKLSTNTRN